MHRLNFINRSYVFAPAASALKDFSFASAPTQHPNLGAPLTKQFSSTSRLVGTFFANQSKLRLNGSPRSTFSGHVSKPDTKSGYQQSRKCFDQIGVFQSCKLFVKVFKPFDEEVTEVMETPALNAGSIIKLGLANQKPAIVSLEPLRALFKPSTFLQHPSNQLPTNESASTASVVEADAPVTEPEVPTEPDVPSEPEVPTEHELQVAEPEAPAIDEWQVVKPRKTKKAFVPKPIQGESIPLALLLMTKQVNPPAKKLNLEDFKTNLQSLSNIKKYNIFENLEVEEVPEPVKAPQPLHIEPSPPKLLREFKLREFKCRRATSDHEVEAAPPKLVREFKLREFKLKPRSDKTDS